MLDPVSVFPVHLTDTTILAGHGVVRVEEIGPLVLAAVRTWIANPICPDHLQQSIGIRPVLDTATIAPVDRYEMPPLMAEALRIRRPYTMFPHQPHHHPGRGRRRPRPPLPPGRGGRTTRADQPREPRLPHRHPPPRPRSHLDTQLRNA